MSLKIDLPEDKIKEFCQRNRIRKLSLFGSVLREDFGPESDIDVLKKTYSYQKCIIHLNKKFHIISDISFYLI